ncbi:hypothetical protein ACEYYB_10400 [Paracoccus sp. p4-l81]|uniref:hypothetical protein n=1 Tax=unclassified Paracoccus (in: a-proteobacteria) TaxID=2688777 RepID=UPI0035B6D5A5
MLLHDLLILAGVALCALSVVLAVVSLAQSRAPVNAARALVLGIVALVAAAFVNPQPFAPADIPSALSRLMSQSGLDRATEVPNAAPEPAPASEAAPAPEPAPAVTPPAAVGQNPADGPRLDAPPIGATATPSGN